MNETPLILIVDDDALLQRATARLLTQAGYRTLHASDGTTGLHIARAQKPDLVLLDVNLPDVSGLHISRQIKTDPALAASFVILISGSRIDAQSQVDGSKSGADGYIVRPVTNAELVARVRGILRIKHAEDRLRASEERFRLAFENANIGMCLVDLQGRFLKVNPALCNMFGYERTELERLNVSDVTQADYQDTTPAFIREVRAGQIDQAEYEKQYRDKQGRPVWGWVASSVLRDATGAPLCLISHVQDITARKQAEAALRASEEKYRTVADFTYDWEAWRAPDGTYLYVSPSCERITGHPASEFLADSSLVVKIAHPEDQTRVIEHYAVTGQPANTPDQHFDFRILTPTGETRWINHYCTAVYGAADRWLGRRESNRDITERRQTEEALRQRNTQIEALRQLGLEFTADLNVESLLHSITQRALELVGGTTCSCYLYNRASDWLERLVFDGPALVPNRSTRQRGEGLIGQVWATGEPILVNDYNAWDTRQQYAGYPTRAVLGVPIVWGQEFLGVLDIVADRPQTYTQADVEQMSLLASHAALAIRNAQLYQHAQQEIVERQKLEHAERAQRLLAETANQELAESLAREQQLARTDPLTGIGNRLHFFELAEHEFQVAARYQHPLAIILLDLDHFKRVNDAFGHTVGDRALMQVARALQAQLRTSDVLARHGGEEFIALLPDTEAASAGRLAERIRERIAALVVETAQCKVQLTVSIGVATRAPNDSSLDALIQRADEALYRAKETGRNRVAVSPIRNE